VQKQILINIMHIKSSEVTEYQRSFLSISNSIDGAISVISFHSPHFQSAEE